MVEFSRKLWYKTVLHTLQKKYDRQWSRCLKLRGTGQIGKLATEFLKSEEIRIRIESEREKMK